MGTKQKIALTFTGIVVLILVVFGVVFHSFIRSDLFSRLGEELREKTSSYGSHQEIRDNMQNVLIREPDGDFFCKKGVFNREDMPEIKHDAFVDIGGDTFFISRQETPEGSEICVAEKVTDIHKELDHWFKTYIIMAIVFSILTYFIGLLFGNIILRPIKKINLISKDFHSGDNTRIPYPKMCKSDDEICQLTDTLNQLFERVSDENDRISRFSSDVAHEFKNGLFEIRSSIQLSLKRGDAADCLSEMDDKLSGLNTLVESLLLLAKVESEQIPMGEADIAEVITDLIKGNSDFQTHENLSIKTQKNKQKLNKNLLEIALSNLVSNAIKFTPEGKNITITLTDTDLSIKDEGVGIDSKNLDSIWGRFYKVSKSRKYGSGHGLGLAITREIVERIHGWKIDVTSKKGEGTEFRIVF